MDDSKKIMEIIRTEGIIAQLATLDDEQPWVRPVSPIIEEDMTIWITTFCSSRKVAQIKQNPKICLSFVEPPSGDRSVFVFGSAKIVADPKIKKRIWGICPFDLVQFFKEGPEDKEYCLLKIEINKIEWWDNWDEGRKVYSPRTKKK